MPLKVYPQSTAVRISLIVAPNGVTDDATAVEVFAIITKVSIYFNKIVKNSPFFLASSFSTQKTGDQFFEVHNRKFQTVNVCFLFYNLPLIIVLLSCNLEGYKAMVDVYSSRKCH